MLIALMCLVASASWAGSPNKKATVKTGSACHSVKRCR